MARPNKQGVDYFPLDVHMDDKIKFVEIKYKLEGFAVVIKLMQRIYANGYWCRWSEDEMLLFSDEIKADFSLVEKVVSECLKRDVFDVELYEKYGILTSRGIQKRYKEIVRRRKDVEVIEEYLLIDGSFGVNDVINPSAGQQNDGKSTQSKVKESKVKESKGKKINRHKYETCDMEMAQQLFAKILENNEHAKKPDLEKWANEFRLMRETDHRTEDQIKYLIDWTQSDSFWKTNILSPAKLRKQFDQLVVRVKEQIKKQNKQSKVEDMKPRAYQSLQDWVNEA
ncbi:DUF4373 domain-containing protein [Fictibacillus gelatini]|uniref:DUF4373 domain-containing protein n=1 Tax=Fictibacillus gelatini TaxID=225985 RepID=UPI00041E8A41|nr:DUF4373 domain-containing protein [Fictibacillus gelatini]